jgi:hypothetical protein
MVIYDGRRGIAMTMIEQQSTTMAVVSRQSSDTNVIALLLGMSRHSVSRRR